MTSMACESCGEIVPTKELAPCPVCGRGTCRDCHCNDVAGSFIICLSCAEGYQSMVRQRGYKESQEDGPGKAPGQELPGLF